MFRAAAWGVGLSVWAGCDPQVATIGIELDAASSHVADARFVMEDVASSEASSPVSDATLEHAAELDAAISTGAGVAQRNCIWMPDLVDLTMRSDGGIRGVDSGVVSATLDSDLGCTLQPNTGLVYLTYARVDGAPLLREGVAYAIPPGRGPGGAMNWSPANFPCEQPFLNISSLWLLLPPPLGQCFDDMRGAGRFLRMQVPVATPFGGDGFWLCEGTCAAL